MEGLEEALNLLGAIEHRRTFHKIEYYAPYPFQVKFHNATGYGTSVPASQRALMCANQIGKCYSISTNLETDEGGKPAYEVFGRQIKVLTPSGWKKVLAWVEKPPEECWRITMRDGQWFECPANHKIWSGDSWTSLGDVLLSHAPASLENAPSSDVRWMDRFEDYLGCCLVDSRLDGEQPLYDEGDARVFLPLPDGVQQHTFHLSHEGVLGNTDTCSPFGWFRPLASSDASLPLSGQSSSLIGRAFSFLSRSGLDCIQRIRRSSSSVRPIEPSRVIFEHQSLSSSLGIMTYGGNEIVSIHPVGVKRLFDMQVDGDVYMAGGLIHHNTTCGAMEVAYHATGMYPDWWEGTRYSAPVRILCGSNTNEQTRDNLQAELFGDPTDDKMLGTGAVPKDMIGERIRKPGVPNAFDSIAVRNVNGGLSRIMFRAYEQGAKKHMGSRIDFGWMDEEPPQEIYSQYLRGTFATGGKLIITFTPEEGVTDVVHQFMTDLKQGQSLLTASWDDAPHMTKEKREEFLAQIPAHEREMRTKGIPKMGSGLVFPVKDEDIVVDPIDIPDHWPRIVGMDFGWDHPSAAAWFAWDRDTDTTYLYHEYRQSNAIIPIIASAIKNSSEPWMRVAWPHDGMKRDSQSGRPLADLYRKEGLNMLPKPFSNPPPPGKKDGDGGQGVEVGIMAMLTAMEEGRFKVFSNCREWLEEKGTYHRKDGQIVAKRDDLISASRYAYQSRRYASVRPSGQRVVPIRRGMRAWK